MDKSGYLREASINDRAKFGAVDPSFDFTSVDFSCFLAESNFPLACGFHVIFLSYLSSVVVRGSLTLYMK